MNDAVQLRQVEAADLPLFFEHQRDPQAVEMVVFRSRDRAEFDAHWAKILANDEGLKRTIVVNGEAAGHIVSWKSDGQREVGYWLDRAFWGRGIATQALREFLAIETTRPLHAGVAKHNAGSIRVLQKCGFVPAGADGDTHLLFVLRG